MIGYITLRFEWLWLPISWTLAGLPLLALLVIARAILSDGHARTACLVMLFCVLLTAGTTFGMVAEETIPVLSVVWIVSLVLLPVAWIWTLAASRRLVFWLWGDLAILLGSTLIGLWFWHIE